MLSSALVLSLGCRQAEAPACRVWCLPLSMSLRGVCLSLAFVHRTVYAAYVNGVIQEGGIWGLFCSSEIHVLSQNSHR